VRINLKSISILSLIVLISVPSFAQNASEPPVGQDTLVPYFHEGVLYTKGSYIACATEEQLNGIIHYSMQRDYKAIEAMVNFGQCMILQPFTPVYLTAYYPYDPYGKIKIRPKGIVQELWTVMGAIRWPEAEQTFRWPQFRNSY